MLKPVSVTWKIGEFSRVPALTLWNYKGEKIHSCFVGQLPVSATKGLLIGGKHDLKSEAKKFYEKHGIRASNVVKILRGIVHNEVHKQFPEWYALNRTKSWNPVLIHRWEKLEHEELMQQCRKDGIANLIPIVAWYGKEPKEIKAEVGKAQWKKFCKNSYSRNRLLYLKSTAAAKPDEWDKVPSTILKSKRLSWSPNVIQWLIETQGLTYKQIAKAGPDLSREVHIYHDTRRMCLDQNQEFNPKWGKRRMHEEHQRLTRLLHNAYEQRKAEQDAEYKKLLEVDFCTLHENLVTFEFDSGVVAKPLVNMQQVQDEGLDMHHCVGGYASMCARGNYVVYSLRKGDVRTTLGISVRNADEKKVYVFSQHYGVCNAIVEDTDLTQAAEKVIVELNKQQKG